VAGAPAEAKPVAVAPQTMLQSLTVSVVEQAEEDEKLLVENVVDEDVVDDEDVIDEDVIDEDVRDALSVCVVGIVSGPSDGFNLSASPSVAGGGQLILIPMIWMQGK
jgi:hypothetical protein